MNLRGSGESGTVAVETAIVAPVLLVLMLLVVYAGRAAQADADVRAAAGRAARAASMAGDPAVADEMARTTAAGNLATAGIDCRTVTTAVDADLAAGGAVTVTVACEITNSDLALLAVPGSRWSTATATQVVDLHRGGG